MLDAEDTDCPGAAGARVSNGLHDPDNFCCPTTGLVGEQLVHCSKNGEVRGSSLNYSEVVLLELSKVRLD